MLGATRLPTTSEVSGPDCICIADIDPETEIGGAILGASARETTVVSERSTPTNGALENMMLDVNNLKRFSGPPCSVQRQRSKWDRKSGGRGFPNISLQG